MKAIFLAAAAVTSLAGGAAQAQDTIHWAAPSVADGGQKALFPIGTPIRLATRTELNSRDNRAGDRFYLEVAEPLVYRGQVVVPVGALAVGEVVRSRRNGHFGKRGEIGVRLLHVQTAYGPIRLSGASEGRGKNQGVLAIGGGALIAWPMFFIHGTSGKLPANTIVTAQFHDDLAFAVAHGASLAAVTP